MSLINKQATAAHHPLQVDVLNFMAASFTCICAHYGTEVSNLNPNWNILEKQHFYCAAKYTLTHMESTGLFLSVCVCVCLCVSAFPSPLFPSVSLSPSLSLGEGVLWGIEWPRGICLSAECHLVAKAAMTHFF